MLDTILNKFYNIVYVSFPYLMLATCISCVSTVSILTLELCEIYRAPFLLLSSAVITLESALITLAVNEYREKVDGYEVNTRIDQDFKQMYANIANFFLAPLSKVLPVTIMAFIRERIPTTPGATEAITTFPIDLQPQQIDTPRGTVQGATGEAISFIEVSFDTTIFATFHESKAVIIEAVLNKNATSEGLDQLATLIAGADSSATTRAELADTLKSLQHFSTRHDTHNFNNITETERTTAIRNALEIYFPTQELQTQVQWAARVIQNALSEQRTR